MTTIGLFYGTETGYTELAARLIKEEFDGVAEGLVTVHNMGETPVERMLAYDYLIVGCPTWDIGQLQADWDRQFPALDGLDLTGKMMAIFGLGDQFRYGDSFCDAIGILGEKFVERGAKLVGFTPADGYVFSQSLGEVDGMFMGLALDEDNESERTPGRVAEWVWQLVDEFDLVDMLEAVS
jgi:flavodoxin I